MTILRVRAGIFVVLVASLFASASVLASFQEIACKGSTGGDCFPLKNTFVGPPCPHRAHVDLHVLIVRVIARHRRTFRSLGD